METSPLLLSGLQHFAFCRRQWALIHVEQQWAENGRTAEGDIFHHRAHDGESFETRGDVLIARGLRVFSRRLNVTGACDVVEFHRDPKGITLAGREGTWREAPQAQSAVPTKSATAKLMALAMTEATPERTLTGTWRSSVVPSPRSPSLLFPHV